MDLSKEYFEMCEAATEIQQSVKINEDIVYAQKWTDLQDFVNYNICYGRDKWQSDQNEIAEYAKKEKSICQLVATIWLPRQDQLSEMITTWNHKYPQALFENLVANAQYRHIERDQAQSIEKYLLRFLMAEFNKEWRNKKWHKC